MPDGSNIQERNPLNVPSTRRNPVLADMLNSLEYYVDVLLLDISKINSKYE